MAITLPNLPYAMDALAPVLSKETLEYHYGKHHKAYVDNLNKLLVDSPLASKSLEEIVKNSDGAIFNNAAQIWNHTFYWNCLTPKGAGKPTGKVAQLIDKHFGSYDKFKEQFNAAGMGVFGSGWAWLSQDASGALSIEKAQGAENPMTKGRTPVLTIDVWEHAYYIDFRNQRAKYLEDLWQLVNWDFVNSQLR